MAGFQDKIDRFGSGTCGTSALAQTRDRAGFIAI